MRIRAASAALLLLLAACSTEPPASPLAGGHRPDVAMRTITLGSGARLFAWTQPQRRAAPWLVYVHGGSWLRGRGDSPTAYALAAHELPRGYQVFSVDYRLSGDARWPAQRDDVAAAVDHIRAGASRFGIAPGRGVVLGESAGGHLASIEASRGRVAGLVDLAGAVDPPAALHARFAPLGRAAVQLVGCPPAACPSTWNDTRAIEHVGPRTPPALLVHSVDDPVVPVTMARSFAGALRDAGRPVTLRVVPGHSHGLLGKPAVVALVDGFLDRVTGRG